MDIVITSAGLQAIVDAQQTGTNAVTICHVGVGRGKYTANKSQTELLDEIKRLPVIEGGKTGDNAIHVAIQDNSTDSYPVNEFGLFLEDGVLFAVYSQQTPILQKLATSNALISFDILLEGANADQIDFGDITYTFAAATTENAGIIEIATDEEVQALECKQRAITPCGLKSLTATETRTGIMRIATEDEAKAGTEKNAVIVPATLRAASVSCAASDTETLEGKLVDKFVTPASLRAVKASTSRNGLVELATEAEAETGTDKQRAVTPSGVRAAIEKATPSATEDVKGLIQLATNLEASAGLDTQKAVTPAALDVALDGRAATTTEIANGTANEKFVTPKGLRSQIATLDEAKDGTSATKLITPTTLKAGLDNTLKLSIDKVYPVGSIYMSTNPTNPADLFGGTWKALEEGRVLIGANSTYKAGSTGGEAKHTLTTEEMPAHTHKSSTDTRGAHSHTRGSMNITGEFDANVNDGDFKRGAFYYTGRTMSGADGDENGGIVGFDASRAWTGATSTEGNHSHNVTVETVGGGQSHNNMQPYLAVYMWTRMA